MVEIQNAFVPFCISASRRGVLCWDTVAHTTALKTLHDKFEFYREEPINTKPIALNGKIGIHLFRIPYWNWKDHLLGDLLMQATTSEKKLGVPATEVILQPVSIASSGEEALSIRDFYVAIDRGTILKLIKKYSFQEITSKYRKMYGPLVTQYVLQ